MFFANKTYRGIISAILIALVSLVSMSCGSDLLSVPPAADAVNLLAEPTESVTSNSVSLAFSTDETVVMSVEYGTVAGAYTSASPRSTAATTSHAIEIVGLDPATVYYYRVVSYLDGARAFPSVEYTFQTLTDPAFLQLATGPTATPTSTSLAISFTSNSACTSLVEYGTVSGTYTASTVQTATATTSHAITLSGLTSGVTYYYRVKMFWDSGDDFVSGAYSAATSAEASPTAAQKARGIWVIGGLSGSTINTVIGQIDLYDPVTGTWYNDEASLPVPVSFAGYAAADGKLFVFGGFDSGGVAQNLTPQIYDISTGLWSTGAVYAFARANIKATVSNGKIYIMGGTTANAAITWAGSTTNYEYTIATNTWASRLAFGASGSERFSFAFSDTIYNLGGRTTATAVAATHDAYSYASNTLTAIAETALAAGRTGMMGDVYQPASSGGLVILAGGASTLTGTPTCFVNQGATGGPLQTLLQYLVVYPFTVGNAWTSPTSGLTTLPNATAFGAAVVSTKVTPARFYLFGGTTTLPGAATGSNNAYWWNVPTPPTWDGTRTDVSGMQTLRWGHGAVTLNE